MGSSHFGELGLGSGRSGSSRRGKKGNSDKPKQPQRGLGVAQLEKIRLQNQMGGYFPSLHSPCHNKDDDDDDVRVALAFSSSPSSSNTASPSSLFAPHHPNIMMGFRENDQRTDIRYGEFQSSPTARSMMNGIEVFQPQCFAQRAVTLPLLEQSMEDSVPKKRRHDRCHSTGSISQNSDSSDTQELDLDLKLSL